MLDDHVEWYDSIIGFLLSYPQMDKKDVKKQLPKQGPAYSLHDYMGRHADHGCLPPKVLEGLTSQYDLFMRTAQDVLKKCKGRKPIEPEDVRELREGFVNFHFLLNKMRDQMTLSCFGYDPYTGLKNKRSGYMDIKKELEKRLRHDMPITILLMRIINLHEILELFGQVVCEKVIKHTTELIESKLRIFDEIYRLDKNEFMISVKVTDAPGAMLFGRRIQQFFDNDKNKIMIENYDIRVKLGFVVADPHPEDNISTLLDNMREDFRALSDKGGVVQHIEIAPIEKYIQGSGQQNKQRKI